MHRHRINQGVVAKVFRVAMQTLQNRQRQLGAQPEDSLLSVVEPRSRRFHGRRVD